MERYSKIYFWAIIILLITALYGSASLSLGEYHSRHTCPQLLGIPACYMVFGLFLVGLFSHLVDFGIWSFYGPIGLLATIALVGTGGELTGMVSCPRTSGGVPMCYISLAICALLLLAKHFESKSLFAKNKD